MQEERYIKKIYKKVKHLIKEHETRDPQKIAEYLGINVVFKTYSVNTKGFFVKTLRNKFIVVNNRLSEDEAKIVLAHELGHAVLHSSAPIHFIREYTLFPVGNYEEEANIFAAELLIDDSDIEELKYYPTSHIAAVLGVNENLVKYKLLKFL
ncbi:MAG TPA: ImmA/IrrE family metallo-endopeptidase [Thermoanaerobacter sp.]|nr:ImmA/IrrE family metallo-endopeptidase [Thermoanaerobacter sp.]